MTRYLSKCERIKALKFEKKKKIHSHTQTKGLGDKENPSFGQCLKTKRKNIPKARDCRGLMFRKKTFGENPKPNVSD